MEWKNIGAFCSCALVSVKVAYYRGSVTHVVTRDNRMLWRASVKHDMTPSDPLAERAPESMTRSCYSPVLFANLETP